MGLTPTPTLNNVKNALFTNAGFPYPVPCTSVDLLWSSRVVWPFLPTQTDSWEGRFSSSFHVLPRTRNIFVSLRKHWNRAKQRGQVLFAVPVWQMGRLLFSSLALSQNILLMLKKKPTVRKPSPLLKMENTKKPVRSRLTRILPTPF